MPLILCYIVAKAETRRADSCLAKNSLDYITILVFTQNQGHTLCDLGLSHGFVTKGTSLAEVPSFLDLI